MRHLDKQLVSRSIDEAKVAELNLSISGESATIAAGLFHTVGLKLDGTVVAGVIPTATINDDRANVAGWSALLLYKLIKAEYQRSTEHFLARQQLTFNILQPLQSYNI